MPPGLALLGILGPDEREPASVALAALVSPAGVALTLVASATRVPGALPRADVVIAGLAALHDPATRASLREVAERDGRMPAVLAIVGPGEDGIATIDALPAAELAFADDLDPTRLPALLERALARSHGPAAGSPKGAAPERRVTLDRRDAGLLTLRLLDELRLGVSPLDGMERALHAAAGTVRPILDADLVALVERDGARLLHGALSHRDAGNGAGNGDGDGGSLPPGLEAVGLAACSARRALLRTVDGTAVFAAPLPLDGTVFCLLARFPRSPGPARLRLAVKAAAQLRIVLGHAWLHARADRELQRSRAMLEIGNAINEPAPLDETIRGVCRTVARTLGARRVLFYQVDPDVERIVRACGFVENERDGPALLDIDTLRVSLGGRCMRERRAALVPRTAEHGGELDAAMAARMSIDHGSALIAPLSDPAAPSLAGALILIRDPAAADFLPADLDICRRIARQLAVLVHRRELQERMEHLALNDPLTGLANRAALEMALDRRVERARGMHRARPFAVVFLDLDGFKHVNDSLGHETGDRLLEAVAARLDRETRPDDVLARLGGDEFAMVLDPVAGPGDALRIARRVLRVLQAPFDIAGRRLSVGASVGVSVYPRHAGDPSSLVRTADAAMYEAKRRGKNAVRCFDDALAGTALRRLEIERALRACVEAGGDGLSLVYQPQVSLVDGRVTGAEALMRWRHAELGDIGPDEFIPVAEDARLIGAMSLWLLDRACTALERLVARAHRRGETDVPPIAINVSPPALENDAFVDAVEARLTAGSLAPSLLCVELTESVVVSGAADVAARIERLRRIGVRLSVDDFGTGWSSLRYLLGLPLDALKIDRAFVQHVVEDPEHATLVRTLVSMAGNLGLSTVAEGIETPAQHRVLARTGCGAAQGWLYSRPLSCDALEDFLDAHDPEAVGLDADTTRAVAVARIGPVPLSGPAPVPAAAAIVPADVAPVHVAGGAR